MGPGLLRAILAGDWVFVERELGSPAPDEWRTADWRWLRGRSEEPGDPSTLSWYPRALLLRSEAATGTGGRAVVGHAGFHGPPDEEGRVELGYSVVAEQRRKGLAEEAVCGLMTWAATTHGVRRFRACVGAENGPSLGLVRKLGFVEVGVHLDPEEGEELVFHRDGSPDG
jgi:RimJ/RimL family protein N-acetyltransferase